MSFSELQNLIDPITMRLILCNRTKTVREICNEFFLYQTILMSETEWDIIETEVAKKFTQMMVELCKTAWSNVTYTEEIKIRELTKTGSSVVETITTRRPSQLPPNIILGFTQEAFKLNTGENETSTLEDIPISVLPTTTKEIKEIPNE